MTKNDGTKSGKTLTLNFSCCQNRLDFIRAEKEKSGETYVCFIYKAVKLYALHKKTASTSHLGG
jgi:hypothetical protein